MRREKGGFFLESCHNSDVTTCDGTKRIIAVTATACELLPHRQVKYVQVSNHDFPMSEECFLSAIQLCVHWGCALLFEL